jgi:hypothetical protein
MKCFISAVVLTLLLAFTIPGSASFTADFEGLSYDEATGGQTYTGPGNGQYWIGIDPDDPPMGGSGTINTFVSGESTFKNYRDDEWFYWEGWAYSNTTDTMTTGFTNQWSAIPGGGANGSDNYGVAFAGFVLGTATVGFPSPRTVEKAYFTNTTYAYFSMRDGDPFSPPLSEGDYQELIITGYVQENQSTGSVKVPLGDYREGKTFLLDEWQEVDLTSLGQVSWLEFTFDGTKVATVPSFVAMDDMTIASGTISPIADAGPHQVVQSSATLDGSQSEDPDGEITAYQWDADLDGDGAYETPIGDAAVIDLTEQDIESLGLRGKITEFQLTVTDNDGLTGADTTMLAVSEGNNQRPEPNADMSVTGMQIKYSKVTGNVSASINARMALPDTEIPDIDVGDEEQVKAIVTLELPGVLPGGEDLIYTDEVMLNIFDTRDILRLRK